MWVDRNGRPVSPPSNDHHVDLEHLKRTPSYRKGKEQATYKKMMVVVEKGLTLGLMIRGGAEYGLGIYITGVDDDSAADLAGLQVGDQILTLNDHDFTTVTHDDAVSLLQRSPRMSMVVRSVGKIPHSTLPFDSDSPPTTTGAPSWYPDPPHSPRQKLSRKGSPRKREAEEPQASSSTADRAELRLDWKSKKLLSENQRITLSFYCNEYQTGTMSVDAFVAELFEMLDTPEKYTLMTEIRALIRDEDLDNFDELIYRREMQVVQAKESMKLAVEIHAEHTDNPDTSTKEVLKALSPRGSFRASTRRRHQDVHHLTVPNERDPEDTHTPSEDSGVDLANGTYYAHGSRKGSRVSTGSRESMLLDNQLQRKPSVWRTSPRSTMRRSFDATSSLRDGNQATRMRRTTLRRHSSGGEGVEERRPNHRSHEDRRWSIGSEVMETPRMEGHLEAAQAVLSRLEAIALSRRHHPPSRLPRLSPVPPPLSPNSLYVPHNRVRRHRSLPDPHAIQARKKQQQWERMQQHRSASVRIPGHRIIPDGDGRFRVIVKKTRPLLGIAIEGGINTTQPLPRIISIHNSGAAFEAGGLKVGHIILEVDGVKMSRRTHSEIAQLIAQAFYSTDRDQVEFLVTETSKNSDAEVRRTSIMVFD